MSNTKCEVVVGIYGEHYVRRKISEGRYEFFVGFDKNNRPVWDTFNVDYDLEREMAYAICDALNS